MGFLSGISPVTAVLLADTKEYSAKLDGAMAKMEEFGGVSDTTGQKLTNFANKASTAIIGLGLGVAAVGVDLAIKFQSALDQVQNTTNATAGTIDKISKSATNLSNVTISSATDIVKSYGLVESAGYKWAAASATVTAAAKLSQITQQNVVTTTQSLIAAQNLGLSKGLSAAKVADTLSIALKGNEAGLQGVLSILSGKVGAAFSGYHQSLGEALGVANEFSLANFTNTRQISSFVSKLGELQGPMVDLTDSNGKITQSTAGWVDQLAEAGLNIDMVKQKFSGPEGLINGLKYLKTTADGSIPTLTKYLQALWGTSGTPAAMALINNLGTLTTTINRTKSASAGGLNTAFNLSQKDIDNQMEELKNKAENVLRGVGMFLLPDVKDLANWTDDTFKYFQAHPLVSKIASDSAIGLFGAAVAYKIGKGLVSVFNGVKNLFGPEATAAQTAVIEPPLITIASNTGLALGWLARIATSDALGGHTVIPLGAGEDAGLGAGGALVAKYGLKDILKGALDYSLPIAIIAGQKNASLNPTPGPNAQFGGKNYTSEVIAGRTFYFPDATIIANNAKVPAGLPGFPGQHLTSPFKKKPGKVTINNTSRAVLKR